MPPVTLAARRPSFRFNAAPASLQDSSASTRQSNLILLDQSKKQQWSLRQGFRQLQKHIRNQWTLDVNSDEIFDGTFERCRIFLLSCPRAKFYEQEIDALRKYVKAGGHLLVTMEEGGEAAAQTNINFLLEEFGIACNNDAVIRTVFYKYFDPKEAFVSNGVLNRAVAVAAGSETAKLGVDDANDQALSFVYPYGATLNLNRDAVAVLSTGTVCFPISRPVCALHQVENGGRVAVLGSTQIFTDAYFDKEENANVFSVLLKWLSEGFALNEIDAREPDLLDAHQIPDHLQLSKRLKMCLQASDIDQTLPADFTKLFNNSISSLDLSMWAETIKCYGQLNLKHEPLSLVVPNFELPQPAMQPAVFPPCFRELPPPDLELFDLDDAFSSTETQLALLTNKCGESEIEFYVRECAELLGIANSLPPDRRSTKDVLESALLQIVEFKKAHSEDYPHAYAPDTHTSLFDPPPDDENLFSDIEDYDDM